LSKLKFLDKIVVKFDDHGSFYPAQGCDCGDAACTGSGSWSRIDELESVYKDAQFEQSAVGYFIFQDDISIVMCEMIDTTDPENLLTTKALRLIKTAVTSVEILQPVDAVSYRVEH